MSAHTSNKNTNSKKTLIILLISVLLVLLIFFFQKSYRLSGDYKKQIKELSDTYERLDSLDDELDQRISKIRELGGDIDTLLVVKSQLEKDKLYLITQTSNQKQQVRKLSGRVSGYRKLLFLKDKEIKQLQSINAQLTEENNLLKVEKDGLADSLKLLEQTRQDLVSRVAYASRLIANEFAVSAIDSRGKERSKKFKSRHIDQLKVTFKLLENEIAPVEGKEILLRVIAPDGNVLFDVTSGSGSFTLDGRELFYTLKKDILYDKTEQLVTVIYDKGNEYAKGQHQIELYTDDYLMGKYTFNVR